MKSTAKYLRNVILCVELLEQSLHDIVQLTNRLIIEVPVDRYLVQRLHVRLVGIPFALRHILLDSRSCCACPRSIKLAAFK